MGDEEGMWGKPSQFFIGDKPIDLTPIDGTEFTCEVKQTNIESVADIMAQNVVDEAVDNARFKANDFDHSITMEVTISPKQMRNLRKMLRVPKLPRKLKKRVKKTCLSEPPKRVPRMVLNYAFAMNHPHLAHKVGLRIEWSSVNEKIEQYENAYQQLNNE